MKTLEKIFSIKNESENNVFKRKAVNILGIRVKFKVKKNIDSRLLKMEEICAYQIALLREIQTKLSYGDDIYPIGGLKFYLPNYPIDTVQRSIVENHGFYEHDLLKLLDGYIPNGAVILDIGANVGNHTVYWLTASNQDIKKVYSFEPIEDTFLILKKNIEINNLQDRAVLYNIGLSDENSSGFISKNHLDNIGGTHVQKGEGGLSLKRLDDMGINSERIDFVKIDVEGHEIQMLNGALETIKKYKPIIFIESFPDKYNEVRDILESIEYVQINEFDGYNYLFKHKSKI